MITRISGTALLAASLLGTFATFVYAQDKTERRESLLKMALKKRQDAKRVEGMAEGVTTQLDVPYLNDNDPSHKLDVYVPAKKDKALPVLVHIHGGGWEIGDKKLMKTTGLFYASQGVLFVTPNYRLSPKAQHPAHVEDCAAALAWTFNHLAELGGDKHRVFLSGHSAGAHLAALLGTSPSYLQKYSINPRDLAGVIPVDTASFDLTDNDNEALVKKFIRDSFGTDQEVLKSASPYHQVSSKQTYPRFLVLNTTNREHAAAGGKQFAEKLKSAGCDARFVSVDHHTHSEMASGMYDPADPVGSAIMKFIFPSASK